MNVSFQDFIAYGWMSYGVIFSLLIFGAVWSAFIVSIIVKMAQKKDKKIAGWLVCISFIVLMIIIGVGAGLGMLQLMSSIYR
ncbi:MAG: hypothetical protein WCI47_02995 [bacterium]